MAEDTASVSGTIVAPNATQRMERFADFMKQRATVEDNASTPEDALEFTASVAEKILNAKTVEEIWDADESVSVNGTDMIDVPQVITSIEVKQGQDATIANPLFGGTYLLVHCTRLSDNEEVTWNTSATGLVSKLVAFERKDAFPLRCMVKNVGTDAKQILKLRPLK
jgi:hypothetical protein